jgi:hypothetical protein
MRNTALGHNEPHTSRLASGAVRQLESDIVSLVRPGLEYQHALDFCAVEVYRYDQASLVAASSLFFAQELLRRLDGRAVRLLSTQTENLAVLDDEKIQVGVWAEPERETGEQMLRQIQDRMDPSSRLYVITSQALSRLLPEWRTESQGPAAHPAGLRRTAGWLRRTGWAVSYVYGFHGPASIFWEQAGRLMARTGRPDIADRYHFKMRDAYIVSGAQVLLAPVVVLAATRVGVAGSATE